MSESAPSPLARLVLFMICLSIAGSILAGAHYYAVDVPAQAAAMQTPANDAGSEKSACATCMLNCMRSPLYYDCITSCQYLVCK